jgi:integrase
VQFAFWTGLRTSELVALDWSDIDWVRGVVIVSRAMTQGMEEPEDGTKTDAGWREVKLLPPALRALQAQKAFTFLKGSEVFQHPRTKERWTGDKAIRESMWIPALKRAGVRYRKPYQTRHTYASMMLMAGENPMWVAKQMGHTDWSLTAKRYARWIPSDMPDAGSKAVERWSTSGQHATASN